MFLCWYLHSALWVCVFVYLYINQSKINQPVGRHITDPILHRTVYTISLCFRIEKAIQQGVHRITGLYRYTCMCMCGNVSMLPAQRTEHAPTTNEQLRPGTPRALAWHIDESDRWYYNFKTSSLHCSFAIHARLWTLSTYARDCITCLHATRKLHNDMRSVDDNSEEKHIEKSIMTIAQTLFSISNSTHINTDSKV